MRTALNGTLFVSLCASAGYMRAEAPVRSLLEMRREHVVVQKWDVSCGAAALATLLTYQHRHPVTEKAVAEGMLRGTDPLRVKYRGGFSLLDLKRYADSRGFKAEAYQEAEAEDLEELKPAIVPIVFHGYPHFVIYRGRVGNSVLLADPAFGNRVVSTDEFLSTWQGGIAFVVKTHGGELPGSGLPPQLADFVRPPTVAVRQSMRP